MKKNITHFILKNLLCLLLALFFSEKAASCPITGDSAVCQNETITYLSSSTGAGFNYKWNAFGGTIFGSGSIATVNWGTAGSGQVTLIVRNSLGAIVCTDVHNIIIYGNPNPFITPSFLAGCTNDSTRKNSPGKRDGLTCSPVCDSTWVTYSTPNHPGSTYAWTIGGVAVFTPSTTNTQTVYWTGTGVGTVKVIETTIHGCVGLTEICVEVVPKPNAVIGSYPIASGGTINACLNQDILFINNSNPGLGSPLWSYTWVYGDGTSNVIDAGCCTGNDIHQYTSAGTYNVMLIAENECHCKDTAYITVVVSSLPGPKISCISSVCPGTTVSYSTDAICPSYNWTAINGTIVSGATSPTVTVTWGTSGPGYLSVSTSGCPGLCSSPSYAEVPIIPLSATIEGPSLVCANDCVEYSITCDIPIDSLVWHAPAGVTINSDSIDKHKFTICFNISSFTSGLLTVDYFKNVPGATPSLSCGGIASLMLNKRPSLFLVYPAEICDNNFLTGGHFPAAPSGNINWTITGPGGSPTYISTTLAANVNFNPLWTWGPGLFTITANDLSGNYCNAPESTNIKVNAIPNAPDSVVGDLLVCPNTAKEYIGFYTPFTNTLEWMITGGTPATTVGPSASILWGPSAPYSISVSQLDPVTGCKSLPTNKTINSILPLSPSAINGFATACANTTALYNVSDVGDYFTWSISPAIAGSVIAGQGTNNIQIEWNNYSGLATILVVREVCGNTINSSLVVNLTNSPPPNITVPSPICEDALASMSTTTTGASFIWNFGDGNTGTGSSVNHAYTNPGNYIIKLTATYTACGDTISSFASIMVNPRPDITISTPDPNIFCGPIGTVNMYVSSPPIGTSYNWYKSPITFLTSGSTYSSNIIGSYFVIGTNSYGCKDTSNAIIIDTLCATCKPNTNYTANFTRNRIGCNKDSFAATLTGVAFGPTWRFDDPFNISSATGNNVTRTFTEPGYYRVELCFRVPNNQTPPTDTCSICIMKVDTIKYKPFFADSIFCQNGLDSIRLKMLNETKILTGFPAPSYQWSINGSPVSSAISPILTLAPGLHTISLLVDGVCTFTKSYNILAPPVASFIMPDSICVNVAVPITNTSTGGGLNAFWDFGDLATSKIYSPNKAYSFANNYIVTLSITNDYGCLSNFRDTITVLPNTLAASITAAPTIICQGDSSMLSSVVTGGYPVYQYLWNNLSLTANAAAYFTGNYYLNATDAYGCFAKSNIVNILVNPVTSPIISGDVKLCLGGNENYFINYPSTTPGGYVVQWGLNGVSPVWANGNNFGFSANTVGTNTMYVSVTSPHGCVGFDTIVITVYGLPNVSIAAAGTLCEGEMHLLDGNSTSSNIIQQYWSTGTTNDTLFTSIPGWYRYTVIDSNGCSATASKTIHPLPDFCGLLTGCYKICDTVKQLTWSGPTGYAGYQWLFNGFPIVGANGDSLNIPLYQSGIYSLVITSGFGCKDTSEDIEIQFVGCGCKMDANLKIECGPINTLGYQTYTMTIIVNNTLGAGTNIVVSSPDGNISSISPLSLVPGLNTVTAIFTDLPPISGAACFTIKLFNKNKVCDTTICMELPDCEGQCETKVELRSSDCLGYDGAGNPMYQLCFSVNWSGANGSILTVNSPGGTISPGSFTINNGGNLICLNYTDLPSYSSVFFGYFNFFDVITQKVCKDSIKAQLKPCPKDTCNIGILGLCAHCKEKIDGNQTYKLEVTINNTLGGSANVNIMNIAGGTFGAPFPNPVASGIQTITIPFTDTGARDSIICFRVVLNNGSKICWADVCIFLPDCDKVSNGTLDQSLSYFVLYPNPSSDIVNVEYNMSGNHKNLIEMVDAMGKTVQVHQLENTQQQTKLNVSTLAKGIYAVRFISDGKFKGTIKFSKL